MQTGRPPCGPLPLGWPEIRTPSRAGLTTYSALPDAFPGTASQSLSGLTHTRQHRVIPLTRAGAVHAPVGVGKSPLTWSPRQRARLRVPAWHRAERSASGVAPSFPAAAARGPWAVGTHQVLLFVRGAGEELECRSLLSLPKPGSCGMGCCERRGLDAVSRRGARSAPWKAPLPSLPGASARSVRAGVQGCTRGSAPGALERKGRGLWDQAQMGLDGPFHGNQWSAGRMRGAWSLLGAEGGL